MLTHAGEKVGRTELSRRFHALPASELEKYKQIMEQSYEKSLHQTLPIVRARGDSIQMRVPVNNRRQMFLVENYPVVKQSFPNMPSMKVYEKCLERYRDKVANGELDDYKLPEKPKRFYLVTLDAGKIRAGLQNLKEYSFSRTASSWNLFLSSEMNQFPDQKISTEMVQEVSAKWASLSEEEKNKFRANAQDMSEQRKLDQPLPYDYEDYILSIAYQLHRKYGGRWMKQMQKKKRAPSPWTVYFSEQINSADLKSYQNSDKMKILSERWKALPEAEKQVYIARAKQ